MSVKYILPIFLTASGLASAVTINVGSEGFGGGVNNWPGGEPPSTTIDGAGQKYLNFGKLNTGVVVTPGSGSSVATGITLWAANDAEERDPASYQIFGTNADVSGGVSYDSSLFTLISEGGVSLPASRNTGGIAEPLLAANSFSTSFANATGYTSYLILFPTLKDEGLANSMQIAEIQLSGAGGDIFAPQDSVFGVQAASTIPEPTSGLLALLGLAPLLRRRRK